MLSSTKDLKKDYGTLYIDSYTSIIHTCIKSCDNTGVMQNGVIVASEIISKLQERKKYFIEEIKEIRLQITKIDEFILEVNEVRNIVNNFNNKINYTIKDKFKNELKV